MRKINKIYICVALLCVIVFLIHRTVHQEKLVGVRETMISLDMPINLKTASNYCGLLSKKSTNTGNEDEDSVKYCKTVSGNKNISWVCEKCGKNNSENYAGADPIGLSCHYCGHIQVPGGGGGGSGPLWVCGGGGGNSNDTLEVKRPRAIGGKVITNNGYIYHVFLCTNISQMQEFTVLDKSLDCDFITIRYKP